MRDAEKNEIDLLLRNLAKRKQQESSTSGAHLDADELNSFAEGQVSPATRSIYVAHLADCDRCRRIVALLAPAASLQNAHVEIQKKQALWTVLTSRFLPVAMRYAIPALAVVILGIAGLLWTRHEPRQFVAEQTKPTPLSGSESSPAKSENTEQAANSSAQTAKRGVTKQAQARERETVASEGGDAATEDASRSKEKSASKTADTTTPTTAAARPATKKDAEVYAPPPPAEKTERDAPKEPAAEPSETAAKQSPETPSSNAVARTESEERGRSDKGRSVARKAAPRSSIFGSAAGGLATQRDDKSVTRTVGGRQFRQIESVWIDTAYYTGMHTTNIKRGSEQYRALVGDEPDLQTIAEQLDGEVVVVWKGKAYRIR